MRRFLEIVRLELTSMWRSHSILALLAAVIGWMVLCIFVITGDGTSEGARQMYLKYSIGGAFTISLVTLSSAAASSISRERISKRLQLTMVRPVGDAIVALGRIVALVSIGALAIGLSAAIALFRYGSSRSCDLVLAPVMISADEEARQMYEIYMNDPETPEEIKKTDKATIIRLLTQKAGDNYQTIKAGETAFWMFNYSPVSNRNMAVRMRFTNSTDRREDVIGKFQFGALEGEIGEITCSIARIPLMAGAMSVTNSPSPGMLYCKNNGENTLMLRPRKDINLLIEADSFFANSVRMSVELLALLALCVSIGVFLSSALGTGVAVFTLISLLAVSEISPAIVEQYPDLLENDNIDRVGLNITRFAGKMTRPLSLLTPIEHLIRNEKIEESEVAAAIVVDMVLLPLFFAALAGFSMRRKEQ